MNRLKEIFQKDSLREDLTSQGFHKLDEKLIDRRPPKIQWGKLYLQSTDKDKIEYLRES